MLKRMAGLVAVSLLGAAPAFAGEKVFTASLSAEGDTAQTGSRARGAARIVVDTDARTVDMTIDVTGLKVADLWDRLVEAPVGPIHLHNYLASGDVVLVLPAPFGSGYADTAKGFSVAVRDYDYAAGATLLKSSLSFEGFMTAMAAGSVVLNIHTDRFSNGEISGRVVTV